MRGYSAESLALSKDRVSEVAGAGAGETVGEELFAVADVLSTQGALRRALTDPSASGDAKSSLVRALFGGKVGDSTIDVLGTAVSARWSSAADMVDAVEHLGVLAVVISAERADGLDDLEDELFRFGRVVAGDPRLRDAVTNKQVQASRRRDLVSSLLEGKASSATTRLAVRAVASRERSFEAAIDSYQEVAAERRNRIIAVVRTAIDLTDSESDQLAAALGRMYGREVHLNVVLDHGVLGGIRVELGDDVIDGTVAGRLDDARRRMTT